MALADHPYEEGIAGPEGTLCWKRMPDGYSCPHPRREHPGESPQQDGPVRSTVERQQERIEILEADLQIRAAHQDRQAARITELEERVVTLEAENLYLRGQRQILDDSERALTARLNHLDTLAREVSERVTRLMSALDT